MIPEDLTLENFRAILSGSPGEEGTSEAAVDVPYKNWYVNMIFVSGTTALLSVFFGVIAAYAFARFRFKGRRMGMLSLLLIQMFPTFLAVVAIYLIVLRVGDIFPAVGLDTQSRADPRLPRRRARREHLADEGLPRLDPRLARRVGPGGRRDAERRCSGP